MRVKVFIDYLLKYLITTQYNRYYNFLLKKNNISNEKVKDEDKWIEKWSVLGQAKPVYYRLFSHYIGNNTNIIPEDICRNIIEPILDPCRYVSYYSDKNMFDKLFGHSVMPRTIFRKMHGFFYDKDYQRIDLNNDEQLNSILNTSGCNKIVIKPTVDSGSGNNVRLFQKENNLWTEIGTDSQLNLNYLGHKYGDDIIIQECLEQSEFMSYYNPTSVNTLRLTLYRSVVTDECHIPSAIIRIGKDGSLIDNAHAGGGYVGIKEDGTLCNHVLNQWGEGTTQFNGIDFTKEHKIPRWDKIIEFAKYIGRNVPHHRLLALDIMVDKNGNPRLIEFNCESYSMWLFQFTTGPALGDFTDEIIAYCKENIHKAKRVIKL